MFVLKVQCRCTFGAKSTRSGERLFTWSSVWNEAFAYRMRYEAVKRKAGRPGKSGKVLNGRTATIVEKNAYNFLSGKQITIDLLPKK